jgi:hypothetical protein
MQKFAMTIFVALVLAAGCKKNASKPKTMIHLRDFVYAESLVSTYDQICGPDSPSKQEDDDRLALINAVAHFKNSSTAFLVGPHGATSSRFAISNQHVVAPLADEGCQYSPDNISRGPRAEDIYLEHSARQECSGDEANERNTARVRETQAKFAGSDKPWLERAVKVGQSSDKGVFELRTQKKMFYQGDMAFDRYSCQGESHEFVLDFGDYVRMLTTPGEMPVILRDTPREVRCRKVLIASQEYDFAILELENEPKYLSGKPVKPFTIEPSIPAFGTTAMVIGHPHEKAADTAPKKIALTNHKSAEDFNSATSSFDMNFACKVDRSRHLYDGDQEILEYALSVEDPALRQRYPHTFIHDCDTSGGSSGSPVLIRQDACFRGENDLKVMGLHWSGWNISKGQFYKPLDEGGIIADASVGSRDIRVSDSIEEVQWKSGIGDDLFKMMPFEEGNSMILMSEIRDHLKAPKFHTGDLTSRLAHFLGTDGGVLAKPLNEICQQGVPYIDDLGRKLGEVIAAPYTCGLVKNFACAEDIEKLTARDFKNFAIIPKKSSLCGCSATNIIWDRGPVDCSKAGGEYCQKYPYDLKCERIQKNCEDRMQNIPDLREKARDIIENFHMCYTGKAALDSIKQLFQIQE